MLPAPALQLPLSWPLSLSCNLSLTRSLSLSLLVCCSLSCCFAGFRFVIILFMASVVVITCLRLRVLETVYCSALLCCVRMWCQQDYCPWTTVAYEARALVSNRCEVEFSFGGFPMNLSRFLEENRLVILVLWMIMSNYEYFSLIHFML